MRRILFHPVILLFARAGLAALFLAACADKIANPRDFLLAVENYRFLPNILAIPFAMVLPWVELVIALLLLAGFWTRPAALISSFCYLAFAIAIGSALIRGLNINCGCFETKSNEMITAWYMIRDLLLLLVSVYLMVSGGGKLSLDAVSTSRKL